MTSSPEAYDDLTANAWLEKAWLEGSRVAHIIASGRKYASSADREAFMEDFAKEYAHASLELHLVARIVSGMEEFKGGTGACYVPVDKRAGIVAEKLGVTEARVKDILDKEKSKTEEVKSE